MKKILVILIGLTFSIPSKAIIHEILVWDGYMQFLPNNLTIQLGDTIQWLPLDPPVMVHTITSTNIPVGASAFDEIWQAPADTFFQYIPQVSGLYEYECTPHAFAGMTGSFEVTGGSSVIENVRNVILAHPNPCNNFIFIDPHFTGFNFKIYNLNSNVVKSGITKKSINLSELKKGVFILVIYADKPKSQKIIIQ